jgi:ABC-type Fe3+-hydroxamate transport system substrate-binding protein
VTLGVLPFLKDDVPVGASLSNTDPKVAIERFSDDAATVSGNTGAIYLENLGLKNLFRETPRLKMAK